MNHTVRQLLAAALLIFPIAQRAQALDLLPNRCLNKLTDETRVWAECVHRFNRNDDRCELPKQTMGKRMQRCGEKGYSKTEIDQAMAIGYQTAGQPQDD